MSVQGEAQVAPRRTAVYRLYDAEGELLYVGATRNPRARLKHHALRKKWWPEVRKNDVQWHPGRPEALRAEAEAIRCEMPRYNARVPLPDGSLRGSTMRPNVPQVARGRPVRGMRGTQIDDDLWERLDEAVKRADPDSNRSVIIRRFARWFVGDIDEMPQRPEPRRPGR